MEDLRCLSSVQPNFAKSILSLLEPLVVIGSPECKEVRKKILRSRCLHLFRLLFCRGLAKSLHGLTLAVVDPNLTLGTGENIERMDRYFPISNFDRVYLVDITPSLCQVARDRFERLGWTNVKVGLVLM